MKATTKVHANLKQYDRRHGGFLQRRIMFFGTALACFSYLTWRLFYTLPFAFGWPSITIGVLLFVCEVLGCTEQVEQYLNMYKSYEPERPVVPLSAYPEVDVLVATHNESIDILYKTINGCVHMDYPDKRKVHIHICDDVGREEVRELAARLGVNYRFAENNQHAKASNLNYTLRRTQAPLVAFFDADMIPRHSFLMKMVPYFFLPTYKKTEGGDWVPMDETEIDPGYKIGFIQSPQSFYNPDLFQYNLHAEMRLPNEQDYFFQDVNVGRNRNNSPLFVGSNALIAREALEAINYIAEDTITEDFETGILIQAQGFRTYAITEVLAHGMAPLAVTDLIRQRERWGRGCVHTIHNVRLFTNPGLSFSAKVSYFYCMVYWWTFFRRFIYISAPVMSVLFQLHVVETTFLELIIFWLPFHLLSYRSLKILSGGRRSHYYNTIIDTSLFPYLIEPIVLESLGIRLKRFVVTGKARDNASTSSYFFAIPIILFFAVTLVALGTVSLEMIRTATVYKGFIAFWLLLNCQILFLSIFFLLGRENYRKADRFYVSLPVTISCGNHEYYGMTTDISETGMAVRMEYPYYLPDDELVDIRIATNRYRAECRARVVFVGYKANSRVWGYSFHIEQLDEANKAEYFQIVYDRHHTLPEKISDLTTTFDDLSVNINQRLSPQAIASNRRLPRIPLGKTVVFAGGERAEAVDFNYKFLMLRGEGLPEKGRAAIEGEPSIAFDIERRQIIARGGGANVLYAVLNWHDFVDNEEFMALVQREGAVQRLELA